MAPVVSTLVSRRLVFLIRFSESSDELDKGTGNIDSYVRFLHKIVTDDTSNKFSETEQRESKQLLMHYKSELSPETEIVYSEVSVYCWKTNVRKIDHVRKQHKFTFYLMAISFNYQLHLVKLKEKEVYLFCVFLTTNITR
jgi:hypothetical protein